MRFFSDLDMSETVASIRGGLGQVDKSGVEEALIGPSDAPPPSKVSACYFVFVYIVL